MHCHTNALPVFSIAIGRGRLLKGSQQLGKKKLASVKVRDEPERPSSSDTGVSYDSSMRIRPPLRPPVSAPCVHRTSIPKVPKVVADVLRCAARTGRWSRHPSVGAPLEYRPSLGLAGKPSPDLSSAGMFYWSAHNPCCAGIYLVTGQRPLRHGFETTQRWRYEAERACLVRVYMLSVFVYTCRRLIDLSNDCRDHRRWSQPPGHAGAEIGTEERGGHGRLQSSVSSHWRWPERLAKWTQFSPELATNDGFCANNDGFCAKNDGFCAKMLDFVLKWWILRRAGWPYGDRFIRREDGEAGPFL